MAAVKVCCKCGDEKPLSAFNRNKNSRDGRRYACRECSAKVTAAYLAMPETVARKRAYDNARYQTDPERFIKYSTKWRDQNPCRARSISRNQKHRRRVAYSGGMKAREFEAWKLAQRKVCHWCGVKCERGYTVDHVIPLSRGGAHEARNLVIACRPCNSRKQAKDPIEFAQSLGKLL